MPYNPSLYMPYQQSFTQPVQQPVQQVNYMQPYDAIISVAGDEGASAFTMPPNSRLVVFDQNEDIMWRLVSDGAGVVRKTRFRYHEEEEKPNEEAEPAWLSKLNERLDSMEGRLDTLSQQRQPRTRKAVSDE